MSFQHNFPNTITLANVVLAHGMVQEQQKMLRSAPLRLSSECKRIKKSITKTSALIIEFKSRAKNDEVTQVCYARARILARSCVYAR